MPYKTSQLVSLTPSVWAGEGQRYLYRYIWSNLPSIYTLKYNWLRNPDVRHMFQKGYIEIHYTTLYKEDGKKILGYTYQYKPYGDIPKCMIIIDPKSNKIYTSQDELDRLSKTYHIDKSKALELCSRQASAYLSLINKITPPRSRRLKTFEIAKRIRWRRPPSITEELKKR